MTVNVPLEVIKASEIEPKDMPACTNAGSVITTDGYHFAAITYGDVHAAACITSANAGSVIASLHVYRGVLDGNLAPASIMFAQYRCNLNPVQ